METKYLYIDLKKGKLEEGNLDLSALKVGDSIEVNLFELEHYDLFYFLKAIRVKSRQMDCLLKLEFIDGHTFDGWQIFKFEEKTTSQQQIIERLKELSKELLEYCSEYLSGKKSLAEAQQYRPDGEKYRPNILEDIKEMESKLKEAEQLLDTKEQIDQ